MLGAVATYRQWHQYARLRCCEAEVGDDGGGIRHSRAGVEESKHSYWSGAFESLLSGLN